MEDLNIDFSRVHKFRKIIIRELSKSNILKSYCKEVWIFGSSINGVSEKKHTAFSDINIAIYPNDINDICSENNNKITREINTIVKKKYNCFYDIIWMILDEMKNQTKLYNNIMKGLRII